MDDFTETVAQIPCCICGVKIDPNPSNMCAVCLRSKEDFGDKISQTINLNYCCTCGRYQSSPTSWVNAGLESPELLQLCLRKINGIKDIKIVDAKFLWTEPHSKRIKVSVKIQKETFNDTILQRSLIITFIVKNAQCPDCCEQATPREHWKAIVQLRQHADGNRTIFWLEQQILSHNAHNSATAIERKIEGGLDFQFNDKPSAERFVSFLKNYCPIEIKTSNKLAGQDLQCNTYDLRFTYSLKCPHVSRQDLILMPNHLFEMTGRKSKIMICLSIGKYLTMIDPFHANTIKIDSKQYWTKPFEPLMTHKSLKRFVIISKEILNKVDEKYTICELELTDEDTYSDRILVKTHLGRILNEGDVCLAYDLRDVVFTDDVSNSLSKIDFSFVIVVARGSQSASSKKKKNRQRPYKLKKLAPVVDEDEFELFMDELEADSELRNGVLLYKNEIIEDQNDVNEENGNSDDVDGVLSIIDE
ncbi:60S ribosomal export protein nmd3 [Tritrichomonas foetus]|uniref:60S ribosomal export protein NMD3 n=1 Tax=Tritrichomonas foetus TaxID=1144522 RepID=A0A1J4K5Y9_9EUKA|nr:60S ribosomal export protein nmd3 [Tritrichomonas foetus]|eukprot:OHT05102.1 60S ribosomal export protein nmd3 [Tritrichomonas foetus]